LNPREEVVEFASTRRAQLSQSQSLPARCCPHLQVPESRSSGAIRSEGAAAETRTGGRSITCSGSQRRDSVMWDGAIRGYQHCALRDGNELADVAKRVDKQDHPHYFRQPQADASL
jgi:hypothetical protein